MPSAATPRVQVEHDGSLDPIRAERREERLLHPVGGRAHVTLRRDQAATAGLTGDHAEGHQLVNPPASSSRLPAGWGTG